MAERGAHDDHRLGIGIEQHGEAGLAAHHLGDERQARAATDEHHADQITEDETRGCNRPLERTNGLGDAGPQRGLQLVA